MKQFYWNKETLNHFKSNFKTKKECLIEVKKFVKNSCDLEQGETIQDLVNDLMFQIYN
tara:strand:+ start:3156 stop:3329 length:174 start_codon:yes stop_codon:yes gene_type:complete